MKKAEKHLGSLPEDIEDVLKLVEKSYNLSFEANELTHIRTFGELSDHIVSKIRLDNKNDCTDQQAFYKLRKAISNTSGGETSAIEPNALLTDLFPKRTRRKEIRKIEKELGLHLGALRPHYVLTYSLMLVLLISIVGLFFKWQLGLAGFAFSVIGFSVAEKTGNEFRDKTLRELIERMTRLNYFVSRREPGTVNITEVRDKIEKLFIENLGLEGKMIDRDSVIV